MKVELSTMKLVDVSLRVRIAFLLKELTGKLAGLSEAENAKKRKRR